MKNFSIEQLRAAGLISVRLTNALVSNGITDLDTLLERRNDQFDFLSLPAFGLKCNFELLDFFENLPDEEPAVGEPVVSEDDCGRFSQPVSELTEYCLRMEYNRLISEFQNSSANIIRSRFPDYQSLDSIALDAKGRLAVQNFNHRTKVYRDLLKLYTDFSASFDEVMRLSDIQLRGCAVRFEFPFLLEAQADFATNYHIHNGRYPMFYILLCFLMNSNDRNVKIIRRSAALVDGKAWSSAELAKLHKLTSTRVGEIAHMRLSDINSDLAHDLGWKQYDSLFAKAYIADDDALCQEIIDSENLQCSVYSFLRLVSMVAPFRCDNFSGHDYAVSLSLSSKFSVRDSLNALRVMLNNKRTADSLGDVNDCLPDSLSSSVVRDARLLVTDIANRTMGITINPIGEFVLPRNMVDILAECRLILDHAGKPLHFNEIFDILCSRNPFTDFDKAYVRRVLFKAPHFVSLGKSGYLGLDTWPGCNVASTAELLFDILAESASPMTVNELFSALCDRGFEFMTTRRSVGAILSNDPRFSRVCYNLYSLSASYATPA